MSFVFCKYMSFNGLPVISRGITQECSNTEHIIQSRLILPNDRNKLQTIIHSFSKIFHSYNFYINLQITCLNEKCFKFLVFKLLPFFIKKTKTKHKHHHRKRKCFQSRPLLMQVDYIISFRKSSDFTSSIGFGPSLAADIKRQFQNVIRRIFLPSEEHFPA